MCYNQPKGVDKVSDVALSDKARTVELGTYEHYKGKRYQVLGVAIHSETLEELVVYTALYGAGLVWVRPLDMFLENVEVKGEKKPRFRRIENAAA